jgi:hypothetical protein
VFVRNGRCSCCFEFEVAETLLELVDLGEESVVLVLRLHKVELVLLELVEEVTVLRFELADPLLECRRLLCR